MKISLSSPVKGPVKAACEGSLLGVEVAQNICNSFVILLH